MVTSIHVGSLSNQINKYVAMALKPNRITKFIENQNKCVSIRKEYNIPQLQISITNSYQFIAP